MGKNMTKKKKKSKVQQGRKYLRAGVLSLLVVLGLGTMVGMAMFNANAKPQRDMKWYVRDDAVQVAAPASGSGYATAQRGNPDGPALAVIDGQATPRPTIKPTMEPRLVTEAPSVGSAPAEDGVETYDDSADASEVFDEFAGSDEQIGSIDMAEDAVESSGRVTLKLTAAGDCTFGGEIGSKGRRRFVDLANKEGYDYFFAGVRDVFENDDLTIVNLEGPLTNWDKSNKHGFVFKGDPEYVNILAGSSVELCNLANNHTMDYGKNGLRDTVNVLEAAKIGYCGYSKIFSTTIKGVRVCALGFTWWDNDKKQIAEAIKTARDNCDLLIVNIHWGIEGNTVQDHKQVTIGHAIIDAGADLVIGTHPHVYQGIEKYKGKYIVYSLGNFCFAGNANPNDKRCMIFQQTFSFNPGMGIAQANITDSGINIIPCTVSSVKNLNDFQPTIMAAKEGSAMLKAIASRSTNFSLTGALWMKDNYVVSAGLVNSEGDAQAQQAVTADIEAASEAEAEPGEEPEAEGESLPEGESATDAETEPEQNTSEDLNTL